MQIKLLLTLLSITILALIIPSGCGGGSGTTQTSSLVTPTPNMTDNMAYITINIKWPEQGMAGKLSISSKDEKDITASMPNGTNRIDVKVYNFKDKDPNTPVDFAPNSFLAGGYVVPPYTTTTIPVPIKTEPNDPNSNILLAIPVKVWAGAFGISGDPNNPDSALLTAEHYMVLKVGKQTANLQLGDYELTVDPHNITINLPPQLKRNTNVSGGGDTPVPEDTPTPVNITATLKIVYPTPANTLTPNPTPKPVEGKSIKFEIIGGNDWDILSLYPSSDGEGRIVIGHTFADGISTARLKNITVGHKTIKASFQTDPNDPNSIVCSDECYVSVIHLPTPTPTITPTPEPTLIPTPLPTPVYPYFIEGTWQERDVWNCTLTGKSYTIKLTQPGTPYIPHNKVCMGVIVTDKNGQIQEGWVYDNNIDLPGKCGAIYESPGFAHFNGEQHHGISWWGKDPNGNNLLPWVQ